MSPGNAGRNGETLPSAPVLPRPHCPCYAGDPHPDPPPPQLKPAAAHPSFQFCELNNLNTLHKLSGAQRCTITASLSFFRNHYSREPYIRASALQSHA
jgi:hypothetical protein